jgi:hypothetical protein
LGQDLLDVLLLVPEAILLLVVILVVVVVFVGVIVLLRLGAVDDEVGGVTALESAPGVPGASSPLLLKLVHCLKFPCKQGNLVIGNALILLIRSCSKRRQSKHQINDNAYKLELPPEFGVSPKFNISALRPYFEEEEDEVPSRTASIQEVEDDEDITTSDTTTPSIEL